MEPFHVQVSANAPGAAVGGPAGDVEHGATEPPNMTTCLVDGSYASAE